MKKEQLQIHLANPTRGYLIKGLTHSGRLPDTGCDAGGMQRFINGRQYMAGVDRYVQGEMESGR